MMRRAPSRSLIQPPRGRRSDAGKMNVAVSRAACADRLVVDVVVVLGQPRSERDVGAEGDDVVEAEPPDAHLLQRLQQLDDGAVGAGLVVVPRGDEPRDGGHDEQQHRVHEGHEPPAPGDEPAHVAGRGDGNDQRRSDELRDRGADVAGAEDAQGEPLALPRPPRRDPRDADAERVAGEPDEERVEQQHLVAGDRRDQVGRDRSRGQHDREDLPTALPVGDDARGQPPDRAVEHRHRGDPGQLPRP